MSNFSTENEELNSSSEKDTLTDARNDSVEQQKAIKEAANSFINELTAINTSLADRQQLTESFSLLSYNVVEQRQQIQTIILFLEQLNKSLSTDSISKLIQIQKSFSAFAQKLEMFEKAISADIHQQKESRAQADEIYQNLNRGWRRLEDEVKEQRQIVGGLASWESFAVLSIGTGFSAAVFIFLGFKLFNMI
jgi:hypothetical protein